MSDPCASGRALKDPSTVESYRREREDSPARLAKIIDSPH